MKNSLLFAVSILLVQLQIPSFAQVIYQNGFSGPGNPGWLRTTTGDTNFHQLWSVASSLQMESGDQRARFDMNIPTLPTNSAARWYGGFFATLSTAASLPSLWQLSFDISLDVPEPIQIRLELSPFVAFPPPFPPPKESLFTYWVEPGSAGWQRIVIDQNTPFSFSQTPALPFREGAFLGILMASHDASGNPLAISQVGAHGFLLDNVVFQQTVPEPSCLGFVALAIPLFFGLRRKCQTRLGR